MEILDDLQAQSELDSRGMLKAIRDFPSQCRQAWEAAWPFELPADYSRIERIVVLGMGGSAIAGDILRTLLQRECSVPVLNVRQYDLPPYTDERTLVIAASFSGNTEETLSAFSRALGRPAKKLAVAGGGELLSTAQAHGIPVFTYHFEGQPRAALGWNLMPLLAIARRLGLMPGVDRDLQEALAVMEQVQEEIGEDVPSPGNRAKQIARRLFGKMPVIYGSGVLTEAAHRWKTQLNETAKVWCFYEELPEANHNSMVGYERPVDVALSVAAVFLDTDLAHPRIRLRCQFTQQLLQKAGADVLTVAGRGHSALAQVLSTVLFGDYVSYYLAILNGVDPSATVPIDNLKAWLAQQK